MLFARDFLTKDIVEADFSQGKSPKRGRQLSKGDVPEADTTGHRGAGRANGHSLGRVLGQSVLFNRQQSVVGPNCLRSLRNKTSVHIAPVDFDEGVYDLLADLRKHANIQRMAKMGLEGLFACSDFRR